MKKLKKAIAVLLCVDLVVLLISGGAMLYAEGRSGAENLSEVPEKAAVSESVSPDESDSEEPQEETEAAEETVQTEEAEPLPQDTTIAFTGDVLLNESIAPIYDKEGISGVLDETMLSALTGADITMVNEEFPFSNRGSKMADKKYTFRVNPNYVSILQDMGVDIVTLANNHALDYGKQALSDSFETLDTAGIRYVGAGDSRERAAQLQTFEVNGKTFGFLAASRVIPVTGWNVVNEQPGLFCTYDDRELVEAITQAKEQCDFVAVFVHWGKERTTTLEAHQTELSHDYIDAGADLVVGAHPHILQGMESYRGKLVFYSLGNFIFNSSNDSTAALIATVSPEGEISCRLQAGYSSDGKTSAMSEEEAQKLYASLTELSANVVVEADGTVHAAE